MSGKAGAGGEPRPNEVVTRAYVSFGSRYTSGPDTGLVDVCLDLEGVCFPAENWADFAVIAAWWTKAITAMHPGSSLREELHFMDGPFSFRLDARGDGLARLTLLEKATDVTNDYVPGRRPLVCVEALATGVIAFADAVVALGREQRIDGGVAAEVEAALSRHHRSQAS